MDVNKKLRLGRISEQLWLFSRGLYGRDYPPKLLKLAAILSEIMPEYIKNPPEYEELFTHISEGFLREYEGLTIRTNK